MKVNKVNISFYRFTQLFLKYMDDPSVSFFIDFVCDSSHVAMFNSSLNELTRYVINDYKYVLSVSPSAKKFFDKIPRENGPQMIEVAVGKVSFYRYTGEKSFCKARNRAINRRWNSYQRSMDMQYEVFHEQ